MEPGERCAAQEHGVAAEDQAHEILEDRFFDRVTVKFERDAIEPVDVGQRHGNQTSLISDVKRHRCRNRRWDGNRA